MKKRLIAVLLSLFTLVGCGVSQEPTVAVPVAETPALTPSPTPVPTPPSSVTLTDETAEEILALSENSFLREVDASASEESEALAELWRLRPDLKLRYIFDYCGEALPGDTAELTVTEPEGAEEALRCLPKLERVDMRAVEWSIEDMERLEEEYPEIDFIWTLRFGIWTVTSDITCFSTLRTGDESSHRYTAEELYPLLRFCHHLRALDLGHNALTDLTLIGRMRELQVLILADNASLTDISPLAELKELIYLELFLCWDIEDFSPLYGLNKLVDLNVAYDRYFNDLSFLDACPDFEHGWFRNTGVTAEQAEAYLAVHPDATLLVGAWRDPSSTAYGWRETERNAAIRHAFTYWRTVVDWRSWDDIEYGQ